MRFRDTAKYIFGKCMSVNMSLCLYVIFVSPKMYEGIHITVYIYKFLYIASSSQLKLGIFRGKESAVSAISVQFSFLYHRKVYEVAPILDQTSSYMFLTIDTRSQFKEDIFTKRGRFNSNFCVIVFRYFAE